MNLNHLLYFSILAETENYTEAAHQLMISQPSLSYAIKKLESDLEVPLFEKKGRNVSLTLYGKQLAQTTEIALGTLTQTIESIRKQYKNENDPVHVGIVPTLASNFLPQILYKERNDQLALDNIQIFHGHTPDILKKLKQGIYDIGLCAKQEEASLTFIPIKKQPFILLINKTLYEKYPNIQENWFEMPLVTYRQNLPVGKSARELIETYTKQPTIVEEFDDETTIGGFVSVNLSVAVVAKTSLLKQFDLPFIPLDEEKIFHTVYLTYLTKNKDSKKIKAFCKLVKPYGDFNQ
ncbi:LysR family transcriptional regulator [Scatolibacter rhodanostii]|uniref:LysR family transcriptional regulator n=1 Tax=Scatolibacter rhodanostii TaxID=2014781 RepID=UPI000C06EC86|nr:LysR family transcriptional regulator [Scatolibacter rhodanostii]